jgi:hypothetical protein
VTLSLHLVLGEYSGGEHPQIVDEACKRIAEPQVSGGRSQVIIAFRLHDHPASGEAMGLDVFISYSHHDKAAADAACAMLESSGVRAWIAPRDVRPGVEYGAEIVEAIERCRVLVLIFSANANHSGQILREVERAVSKGIPIVPVRIEEVLPTKSMEYFLGTIHWLEALTPPLEQHLRQLVNIVSAILARDGGAVPGGNKEFIRAPVSAMPRPAGERGAPRRRASVSHRLSVCLRLSVSLQWSPSHRLFPSKLCFPRRCRSFPIATALPFAPITCPLPTTKRWRSARGWALRADRQVTRQLRAARSRRVRG